jgi:uncharacterized protein
MKHKNYIIAAFILGVSLFFSAWILGISIQKFNGSNRTLQVKGFSEKEVKSDLVIWSIKVKLMANTLQDISTDLEQLKNTVVQFLLSKGIKQQEITVKDLVVIDRQSNEYINTMPQARYLLQQLIEVRSGNVDRVQQVSRMTNELLKAGVALTVPNEYSNTGVRFLFTRLNDIKPQMLIEANKNAKDAALQFANESNVSLGKLKKASQGLFTIKDRDQALTEGGDAQAYDANGYGDVYKKVRVVINAEYTID